MKTTLRDVKNTSAIDLTGKSATEIYKLLETIDRVKLAYSIGTYGLTGCLIQDAKTGQLYKVTSRCAALFILM